MTYEIINEVLNYSLLWNTVWQVAMAVVVYFLVFFFLRKIIHKFISKISVCIKDKKETFWVVLLKLIRATQRYFFLVLEVYVPLKVLSLPEIVDKIINVVFFVVFILQIIRFLNTILLFLLRNAFVKKWKLEKTTQNALQIIVKVIVRVVWWLLLLSNLGIEVSPLIASLWIWWIAVAFALQNMLQDLFSSLSILSSRPFDVGDFVTLTGGVAGTVKDIWLKSTLLESVTGNDVRIPNNKILSDSLENFGRMKYRRSRFVIWVTYETVTPLLRKIPDIVKDIVLWFDGIEYEWTRLVELGDFSINFKISYRTMSSDYALYMENNEKIMFLLLEKFAEKWIEFAYPTQVVHLTKN